MKKKFLIGLIISLIFFTITYTFATSTYTAEKATFPIFINDKEWKNSNSVFVIDGTTYLPLKSVCEILDVDINWNEELNRVEINVSPNNNENDEELFGENYWENYYEEYYNEIFSRLYEEDEPENEEYIESEEIDNTLENEIIDEEIKPETATYIGNKNTKKLHRSTCQSAKKLKEENREYFSSVEDAKGYTKCQICNP